MEPITLITVIVAIVATLATGYAYFRSSAVKVWEQNSAAYKARVLLLEEQNKRLEETVRKLETRIRELESRPDMERVISAIHDLERSLLIELRNHG
jgi:uncharacterized protein YlxW (UPF0749 family)